MVNLKNTHGQSMTEALLVIGLLFIPITFGGFKWVKLQWDKTECAFNDFKKARIELIRTRQNVNHNGIVLVPLENLDRDKGALGLGDLKSTASQLLEQLSSS